VIDNFLPEESTPMLASTTRTDRHARLDQIIRQALASGMLNEEGSQYLETISTQKDLTPAECRMLEILQDALQSGAIQQGQ
jgi:hypothetical protein